MVYRTRTRTTPKSALPPPNREGHLYYVRLRTPVGLLYKIGFTTMDSVEARLSFKGDGAEQMIDKVLCFLPFKDAWGLEQELHRLLKDKAAFCGWAERMPLHMNGQSELYCVDVLEMDHEYSLRQTKATKTEIMIRERTDNEMDAAEMREQLRIHRANTWSGKVQQAAEANTPGERPGWLERSFTWVIIASLRGLVALLKPVSRVLETGNQKRLGYLIDMLKMEAAVANEQKLKELRRLYQNQGALSDG